MAASPAIGSADAPGRQHGGVPLWRPVAAISSWSWRSGRPLLEQVADLGEEFLILGGGRQGVGIGFFGGLRLHDPAQELHDEDEQGQGQDQEADDVAEELAVGDRLLADRCLLYTSDAADE